MTDAHLAAIIDDWGNQSPHVSITDLCRRVAEAAETAERERCKAAVQYNQCRNGYHRDEHGANIGHFNMRMFEWIDNGLDPRIITGTIRASATRYNPP